jgi:hypothetical protein
MTKDFETLIAKNRNAIREAARIAAIIHPDSRRVVSVAAHQVDDGQVSQVLLRFEGDGLTYITPCVETCSIWLSALRDGFTVPEWTDKDQNARDKQVAVATLKAQCQSDILSHYSMTDQQRMTTTLARGPKTDGYNESVAGLDWIDQRVLLCRQDVSGL